MTYVELVDKAVSRLGYTRQDKPDSIWERWVYNKDDIYENIPAELLDYAELVMPNLYIENYGDALSCGIYFEYTDIVQKCAAWGRSDEFGRTINANEMVIFEDNVSCYIIRLTKLLTYLQKSVDEHLDKVRRYLTKHLKDLDADKGR